MESISIEIKVGDTYITLNGTSCSSSCEIDIDVGELGRISGARADDLRVLAQKLLLVARFVDGTLED